MSKTEQNRKNLRALLRRCAKRGPRDGAPRDLTALLIYAVLEENTTSARGKRGLEKIGSHFVDYNDLRVSPRSEIVQALGVSYPQVDRRADRLVETLKGVFNRRHTLDLSFLAQMSKCEVREFLEQLGASDYVVARLLLATGAHALPVDGLIHAAGLKLQIAAERTEPAALRAMLERQVPVGQAAGLFAHLRQQANRLAATQSTIELEPMEWESEEAKRKRRRRQWAIATPLAPNRPKAPGTAPPAAAKIAPEKKRPTAKKKK